MSTSRFSATAHVASPGPRAKHPEIQAPLVQHQCGGGRTPAVHAIHRHHGQGGQSVASAAAPR